VLALIEDPVAVKLAEAEWGDGLKVIGDIDDYNSDSELGRAYLATVDRVPLSSTSTTRPSLTSSSA
jgi:hypothetical protein